MAKWFVHSRKSRAREAERIRQAYYEDETCRCKKDEEYKVKVISYSTLGRYSLLLTRRD